MFIITNISNMFLARCWRLKTSSRLLVIYNFNEMTILEQDLYYRDSQHLPFLFLSYSPFPKMKH